MQKFTILGRLPGQNEIVKANRTHWSKGSKLKKEIEQGIVLQLPRITIKTPCVISIDWYEPNLMRDDDNVVSAKKFIFDAMQKKSLIPNDSQKFVKLGLDRVLLDRKNPRIEITVLEYGD